MGHVCFKRRGERRRGWERDVQRMCNRYGEKYMNLALGAINSVAVRILAALRPLRSIARVTFDTTNDRRIGIVTITMRDVKKSTVIALYATAQQSRPLSPRDVVKKLRRMSREMEKILRGTPRDSIMILVAADKKVRSTIGARRILARSRVMLADPDRAKMIIASIARQRLLGAQRKLDMLKPEAKRATAALEQISLVMSRLASIFFPEEVIGPSLPTTRRHMS